VFYKNNFFKLSRQMYNHGENLLYLLLIHLNLLNLLNLVKRRNMLLRNPSYGSRNFFFCDHLRLVASENERDFIETMRMPSSVYQVLEALICPQIPMGTKISRADKLMLTVFYLAQGHNIRRMASTFGNSTSTICRVVDEVLDVILRNHCDGLRLSTLADRVVPGVPARIPFRNYFENCIGSIDGSHFQLTVPARHSEAYRNRKGVTSSNVLFLGDFQKKILFIAPGCEGSAHDGFVLDHSLLKRKLSLLPEGYFVLGDCGYPLTPRILVPFRGTRCHLNEFIGNRPRTAQELFNLRHSTLRSSIERKIGLFKRKFAIFRGPIDASVGKFNKLVFVAAFLHNFIIDQSTIIPEDEMETQIDSDSDTEESAEELGGIDLRNSIVTEMWEQFH
jgi:hypothetical protein